MTTYEPKLNVYCLYNDGEEKNFTLDIDLSYDPLLGKPYVKEWISSLLNKKFNTLENIEYINISQINIENCQEDLPYWYYELCNTR
jgi:hypothetical protein